MTGKEAESIIQSLPFAKIEIPFSLDANGTLTGSVGILHKSMSSAIVFKVIIHPFYPCKILGHEPIQFVNLSLIEYPHIMSDGSLCFHTSYLNDEKERLYSDLVMCKKLVASVDRFDKVVPLTEFLGEDNLSGKPLLVRFVNRSLDVISF